MSVHGRGLSFGVLVGLAWGLDTVLLGAVSSEIPVLASSWFGAYLVVAFLHDTFCFLWLVALTTLQRDLGRTARLLIETKKAKVCCIAAVIGAPLGMSAYVLGIGYATPAYASSISVIYPGIGALLAFVLLKERVSRWAMVGVLVSIAGAIALSYSKIDLSLHPHFSLGVAFAFIAALCWALEGVIVAYAMGHIEDEDHVEATPRQLLTIRYFTSALIYSAVVIPLASDYDTVMQIGAPHMLALFGIAAIGVITYFAWYKAVSLLGAAMGTALNSTSAFWAIVFSWLILGTTITTYLAACCAIIVLGVFVFALNHGPRAPKLASKDRSGPDLR